VDSDRRTAVGRRGFLAAVTGGTGALLAGCARRSAPAPQANSIDGSSGKADVTLRIGPVLVDIAKDHTISTIGYNGSVPGPLIRLREGVPVIVDLFNDTDSPELVHWHGHIIPADVDGAAEEKSLQVPPHSHLRYRLTPQPSGSRFVHTHTMPMSDVSRGTYTGQFAFVYIEPKEVKGFRKVEADVIPAMDGLTLFHCHQQLHMDYGFKLLFNVV
jgi:FtsP/CotA-like multicopper oxidase with cupredoxin domain